MTGWGCDGERDPPHSHLFMYCGGGGGTKDGGALHECANAISYYKLGLRLRWMMEFVSQVATFQNGIPLKKMRTHTHRGTYRERVPSHSRSRQQNSWKCRRDIFHSRGDLFVMMVERALVHVCFWRDAFFLFAPHTCQGLDTKVYTNLNFMKEILLLLVENRIVLVSKNFMWL